VEDLEEMKSFQVLAIAIVVLHLAISIPHGMAHSDLHIQMELWQNVYIWIVITLLPLVAAVLIWKHPRSGFLLLLCSMVGSFVFGFFYHFIAAGPDNIASHAGHASAGTFLWTAVMLALIEAAGFVIGLLGWCRSRPI
jgi:lipopolysaccharide export LptBFGC system permease protein LptF